MTSEREHWQRVREIFESALDRTGDDRRRFLDEACENDASLRAEVEELLAEDREVPSDFMVPPSAARGPDFEQLEEADPALPLLGTSLGDFELIEELGRGGMGTVFRARQKGLDRDVAVKVVSRPTFASDQELERFRREARAAARLDHPGIARVLVEGTGKSVAWFAMELVDGPSLADELRRTQRPANEDTGTLPQANTDEYVREAARIGREIADALAHAHAHGVVHRDVKPSNVLLTPNGSAKLVDFGVARDMHLGTITRSDQLVGSLPYMSPEQARVVKLKVDERTDVYSTGVVLYELLARRRPFEGGTTHEVLTKIRTTEPRSVHRCNSRVPNDLAVICETAMAKDASERYASAGALRDDLDRFLSKSPIAARPASALRRARRFARRRRGPLLVVAAIAAASIATFFVQRSVTPDGPHALVTVEAPKGTELFVRRIDPYTSMPSGSRRLGRAPFKALRLKPGFVRIVAKTGQNAPVLEYSRELFDGSTAAVQVAAPSSVASNAGMIRIAAGTLRVTDGQKLSPLNQKVIEVPAFLLDEAEVSVGDYREFLAANPHIEEPALWTSGRWDLVPAERPASGMPWKHALAFAEWRGKRLPTYAEWMLAARGEDLRQRPWPDNMAWFGANSGARYRSGEPEEHRERFVEATLDVRVAAGGATPDNVMHMLGNVAEWIEGPVLNVREDPPVVLWSSRYSLGGWWDNAIREGDLRQIMSRNPGGGGGAVVIGFRCARSES